MGYVPSVLDLVRQLRTFDGYRTLWLDERSGGLWHAEPDEELEARGYRYVATLMRPGPEAVAEALGRAGVTTAGVADRTQPHGGWVGAAEPMSV